GVDGLRHPDQHDRDHEPAPVVRPDAKSDAGRDHDGRRSKMEPGVVLGLQHDAQSVERMAHAAQPSKNRKTPAGDGRRAFGSAHGLYPKACSAAVTTSLAWPHTIRFHSAVSG